MAAYVARVVPAALAALAAASAWISLGQSAVLDAGTMARVVSLPPLLWLATLVVLGIGLAAVTRLSVSRSWPLALSILVWLPYLPGRVPAAFLMWQGPLEGLVWIAIVAGLLFAGPLPLWRATRVCADPRRAPWIAAATAAIAYAGGAWSLADLLPGGDEPHYLVIAQSVLLDGDLRIENNHERGDYRAYTDQTLKPDFIRRGIDGEIYPMHAPGISALVLPAFAVAGYPGAVAAVIAMTAAASAVAWHVTWLLTASASGAWVGWAAVFLTTPFFFHGFTIYPDGAGGLFTIAGVWLLVMLEAKRVVTMRHLVFGGAALAVLPWLHARFVLIAAALGAVITLRLLSEANGVRRASAFLVLPALVAVSWFLYFWIIWGTPNPSAPQGRDLMMTAGQIWIGAAGLLFDQQFGLGAHAPVYATAFAGFVLLARDHRRLSLELLLAIVPYLIATSSFAAWWGGVSAPARYLAALMPIAALPVALWWRERSSDAWRAFTLLVLGISVVMVVPKLIVDGGVLIYNDRAGYDLFLDWVSRAVDLPLALPSVHRQSLAAAWVDAAVWAAAGAGMAGVAWLLTRRRTGRGVTWTASAAAAAAALMTASTVVWAEHGAQGARPGLSQWTFLQSWSPSVPHVAFQLQPGRRLGPEDLARRLEVTNLARASAAGAEATVLRASMLPAGEYDLVTSGDGNIRGEVFVQVGRTDRPIEHWRLDGRRSGFAGFTLTLPVPVHSVTIRADEEAGATAREFRLRVRALAVPPVASGFALRAIRYGRTQAFFMDDSSYMEPGGFWTRGEESTTVVLNAASEDAGVRVMVQSGPVPTSVEVTVGTWTERVTLAPNQQRALVLPAQPGTVRVVTLRTGAWFRPSDQDAGNGDTRRLGVFVTLP